MGIIYKLRSPTTETHIGKDYIGQTICTLQKRLNEHKSAAKTGPLKSCRILNNAIRKYGIENFEKTILWEGPDECLDFFEILFIVIHNTLSPNGYNLTTGGGSSRPSDDTKQKMRESALARDSKAYRKIEANKDLPKYVCSYKHGYKIAKHARAGGTRFFVSEDTPAENLVFTLAFLKRLDDDPELMIPPKTHDLPKGIRHNHHGFSVHHTDATGRKISANFKNKKYTTEECYEFAVARLAQFKETDK